ncbi:Hypothetical_protein [Hexamita inflata]|uniref:Hypothetical_protein n=1 Tax=Hexamita inflata TaxID=28002 RepID=A0ABP1HRE5_9EUKA
MIISEFSSIDEKFTTMLGTCLTYNGLKQKKLSNLCHYVNALISTNQSGICENLSLESTKYHQRKLFLQLKFVQHIKLQYGPGQFRSPQLTQLQRQFTLYQQSKLKQRFQQLLLFDSRYLQT